MATQSVSSTWHVLGAGAIGGWLACELQASDCPVTLLQHRDAELTRRLTLSKAASTASQPAQTSFTFEQESVTQASAITALLVCTKAWATEDAVRSVAHRLSDNTQVVLLGNGMGLAERVLPLIGDAALVLGSTTAGCLRSDRNTLHLSSSGTTYLGPYQDDSTPPMWLPLWQRSLTQCHWQRDIRSILLAKTAVNAVINPLTAIHQVKNGALLKPQLLSSTEAAITEVQRLLTAAGETVIANALPDRVKAICQATAQNDSSMKVDLARGNPTEVEWILGWLLKHLLSKPPATPVLQALYEEIQGTEKVRRSAS
ncbi:2-dehydropantoate 2-reductase [Luminiphilus sp.]|nr:2-dehydropantoate 2-reductase [Luminiphilus sp.]MDA8986275.1 2-dehydropantoate 2-reductase [Luminiphilus sp.]